MKKSPHAQWLSGSAARRLELKVLDSLASQFSRFLFLVAAVLGLGALGADPAQAQGTLTNGWTDTGTISPAGDSDSWTFSANTGDFIDIRADEITQVNNFAPWVRLYGPTGLLIASSFGATSAEVSQVATNSGHYLVLIANNPYYTDAATGTYGLTDGLKLRMPRTAGTNETVSGVGGNPGAISGPRQMPPRSQASRAPEADPSDGTAALS